MLHQLHALRQSPTFRRALTTPSPSFERVVTMPEPGTATLLSVRPIDGCPADTLMLDLTGSRHLRPGSDLYMEGVRVGQVSGGGGTALRLRIDSAALIAAVNLVFAEPEQATRTSAGDKIAPRLSPRQREVLALVASGCSNKRIALDLGVSPATIKTHVASAIATIGARNRTDAAIKARERGWI